MFNKKCIVILLFSLLCILAISSVSAADDVADDAVAESVVDSAGTEIASNDADYEKMTADESDSNILSQDNSDDEILDEPKEANAEISQGGKYFKNATINVVVKDNQTDEDIDGAEIYLEFSNGKNATVTTVAGVASYKINFAAGTYSVTASPIDKDVVFFSDVTLNNITILPHNAKITIKQNGINANDKTLIIKVYDTYTKKGFAEKVYLDFSDGKKTFVKTNDEGVATYRMKFPGTYSVEAYTKNNNIIANKVKASIKVNKISVVLNPMPLTAVYASGKYLNIKVTTYGQNIGGVKLKIDIYTGKNKKTYYSKTISTGWAKLHASKLSVGTHKVVVSVASKDLHAGKMATTTITIKKAHADISAPTNIQVASRYSGKYEIKLTDYYTENPISNFNVQFKVFTGNQYRTYNVKTNNKGYACIPTKGFSIGKHNVVVSFGNNYYNNVKKTGSFVVSDRIPTYMKIHDISNYDGELTYQGSIFDVYGNKFYSKAITVKYSGGQIKTVLSGDSHEHIFRTISGPVTLYYAGDNIYLPCEYTFTV